MKISPVLPRTAYAAMVKDNPKRGYSGHSDDKSNESREEKSDSASREEVSQAVNDFQTELENQIDGLNASVVGAGPGLKVILKDEEGALVRQLTGAEFLRLRQASDEETPTVGKILDQKL
jgi:hypothetical protein